jgi:Protein of unknown function (DUF3485)
VGFLWTAVTATAALGLFFFLSLRPAANAGQPAPDLAALLPAQAPGWEVITADDLYQFSDILQTTHLLQRTYLRRDDRGRLVQLTVYIAYWPPGQATVSRVASHTPDACWPGSGWIARPLAEHREIIRFPDLQVAPAEHRLFESSGALDQHVWFWHIYDGRAISHLDPYSVPALVKLAWKYGFRRQGDQYFIRVSSNLPWSGLAGEPLVHQIFTNLAKTGL